MSEARKKKFAIKPTDEQLKLNSAMLEATNQTLSAYDDFMATVATTIGSTPVHPSQLSLTRIFSKARLILVVVSLHQYRTTLNRLGSTSISMANQQ